MATEEVAVSELTGAQKCAIVLLALGDEVSSELLKRMTEEEVRTVSHAIAQLPEISEEQAHAVLGEFHNEMGDQGKLRRGSVDVARRLLVSAFGEEGSKKHVESLPEPGDGPGPNHPLQRADPLLLARFIRSEHPQTIALVLSHLKPGQSAALLESMEPEIRAEVTARLARLDQIPPAVMAKISTVITKKLESLGELKRESSGGLRAVAEIFNQMNGDLSTTTLEKLEQADPQLVEAIRQKMFVFEDLLSIDANGVKELLARADRRQLTLALKGASEEVRKHLLSGMSQRGGAMLLEDMEALGPVKIRDVEGAQQQIIAVVRLLESEGIISLKSGGGGDDQYIV